MAPLLFCEPGKMYPKTRVCTHARTQESAEQTSTDMSAKSYFQLNMRRHEATRKNYCFEPTSAALERETAQKAVTTDGLAKAGCAT